MGQKHKKKTTKKTVSTRDKGASGSGQAQAPGSTLPTMKVDLKANEGFFEAAGRQDCPARLEGDSLQVSTAEELEAVLEWFVRGAKVDSTASLSFSESLAKEGRALVHNLVEEKFKTVLESISNGVGDARHITVVAQGSKTQQEDSKELVESATKLWKYAGDAGLQISRDEVLERLRTHNLTPELEGLYRTQVVCSLASEGNVVELKDCLNRYPHLVKTIPSGPFMPLHSAACQGQLAAIELLIEAGIDVEAKDNMGKTALQVAQMSEQCDAEAVLLRAGARDSRASEWPGEKEIPDVAGRTQDDNGPVVVGPAGEAQAALSSSEEEPGQSGNDQEATSESGPSDAAARRTLQKSWSTLNPAAKPFVPSFAAPPPTTGPSSMPDLPGDSSPELLSLPASLDSGPELPETSTETAPADVLEEPSTPPAEAEPLSKEEEEQEGGAEEVEVAEGADPQESEEPAQEQSSLVEGGSNGNQPDRHHNAGHLDASAGSEGPSASEAREGPESSEPVVSVPPPVVEGLVPDSLLEGPGTPDERETEADRQGQVFKALQTLVGDKGTLQQHPTEALREEGSGSGVGIEVKKGEEHNSKEEAGIAKSDETEDITKRAANSDGENKSPSATVAAPTAPVGEESSLKPAPGPTKKATEELDGPAHDAVPTNNNTEVLVAAPEQEPSGKVQQLAPKEDLPQDQVEDSTNQVEVQGTQVALDETNKEVAEEGATTTNTSVLDDIVEGGHREAAAATAAAEPGNIKLEVREDEASKVEQVGKTLTTEQTAANDEMTTNHPAKVQEEAAVSPSSAALPTQGSPLGEITEALDVPQGKRSKVRARGSLDTSTKKEGEGRLQKQVSGSGQNRSSKVDHQQLRLGQRVLWAGVVVVVGVVAAVGMLLGRRRR